MTAVWQAGTPSGLWSSDLAVHQDPWWSFVCFVHTGSWIPRAGSRFDQGCGLGGRVSDEPPLPRRQVRGARGGVGEASAALARGGTPPPAPCSAAAEAETGSGSPQTTVAGAQVPRPVLCHTDSRNVAKFYWLRWRGHRRPAAGLSGLASVAIELIQCTLLLCPRQSTGSRRREPSDLRHTAIRPTQESSGLTLGRAQFSFPSKCDSQQRRLLRK